MVLHISVLPDLQLEMIFRYLSLHHLYGRGEVGDHSGAAGVCSRWHRLICGKRMMVYFEADKTHFNKQLGFAWQNRYSLLNLLSAPYCKLQAFQGQAGGGAGPRLQVASLSQPFLRSNGERAFSLTLTDGSYHVSNVLVMASVLEGARVQLFDVILVREMFIFPGVARCGAYFMLTQVSRANQGFLFDRAMGPTQRIGSYLKETILFQRSRGVDKMGPYGGSA